MMKKSVPWSGLLLLAIFAGVTVLPAMATLNDGTTYQCWSFSSQTGPYGIMPDQDSLDNDFGVLGSGPVALIQNLPTATYAAQWTNNYGEDNGSFIGGAFKIILDIPNQPIENPYKDLTVTLRYQGEILFTYVTGVYLDGKAGTIELIDSVDDPVAGTPWTVSTRHFRIYPNPMEETIIVGLKGVTDDGLAAPVSYPAILDQICVYTECVPEPMTLSLLALGAGILARRKR